MKYIIVKRNRIELFGLRFSYIKWTEAANLPFNLRKNRSGYVLESGRHSFYFYYNLTKKA